MKWEMKKYNIIMKIMKCNEIVIILMANIEIYNNEIIIIIMA